MNKYQNLFITDGRFDGKSDFTKIRLALMYSLIDPKNTRYILSWIRQLRKGIPLDLEKNTDPWITYRAIRYLDKVITKDSRIFEYGSGGSSLYFALRAKSIVSIEHNKDWYKKITQTLKEYKVNNCQIKLVEGLLTKDIHNPYLSLTQSNFEFEKYVNSIGDYSDGHFDLVIVDGRSRVQCVKKSYKKVRSGGMILLDNSERKDYLEAHVFLSSIGAKPINMFGLVAGYAPPLSETTIWRIP
jgi:precorrin-6B methylase 2